MTRLEALDRHEVPLQEVYERDSDISVSIPVHLSILNLPNELRKDQKLVSDAQDVVRPWFNEDMEYHLECLRKGGYSLRYLKGYEAFDNSWSLAGVDDGNGFLELHWDDKGEDGKISFLGFPSSRFYNQIGPDGQFYVPANSLDGRSVEIIQRSVSAPDTVLMNPERMSQFGTIDELRTNIERGVVEVFGQAFCPDNYLGGMNAAAKGFLLRNFAVFYLNRLLEIPRRAAN